MTTRDGMNASLTRLKSLFPPPAAPLGLDARRLPDNPPPFPDDLLEFIHAYGSGYFENGGMFLAVLNPYEEMYWKKQETDLQLIRRLKAEEGEEYIPYGIWPERPGLLLWGYGQDRKHFFWLTEGDPASWPVIVMYDIEIFTAFEMPMLAFMEKLLCGDLDCSFIGGADTADNCLDPQSLRFVPRILPA